MQEQTRDADRGHSKTSKGIRVRSNEKVAKRVGLDGKGLLSTTGHGMNDYVKISQSPL